MVVTPPCQCLGTRAEPVTYSLYNVSANPFVSLYRWGKCLENFPWSLLYVVVYRYLYVLKYSSTCLSSVLGGPKRGTEVRGTPTRRPCREWVTISRGPAFKEPVRTAWITPPDLNVLKDTGAIRTHHILATPRGQYSASTRQQSFGLNVFFANQH